MDREQPFILELWLQKTYLPPFTASVHATIPGLESVFITNLYRKTHMKLYYNANEDAVVAYLALTIIFQSRNKNEVCFTTN